MARFRNSDKGVSWGFAHAFTLDEAVDSHVKVTQVHQGNTGASLYSETTRTNTKSLFCGKLPLDIINARGHGEHDSTIPGGYMSISSGNECFAVMQHGADERPG